MTREEQWADIEGFPGYRVSDLGRVYGVRTETFLQPSEATSSGVKVNLMKDGHIQTRSVRTLVANAFLDPSEKRGYENPTPINVNGDPWDNSVENLMWRPRWFAWKYTRQFDGKPPKEYFTPVRDIRTNQMFDTVIAAGIYDGVLWEYVYGSILTGRPVFPTGSRYEFVEDL